jgi:hypothetical protein
MGGPIHSLLAMEHRHLEQTLREATADAERIDPRQYACFRGGLLRHIAAEEKILIPAAMAASNAILTLARKIRIQHGAITALLAPPPSPTVLRALRTILEDHDTLEEMSGGLYDYCEGLLRERVKELLDRLRAAPAVAVSTHSSGPEVIEALRRILDRAGYDLATFEGNHVKGGN